MKLLFQIAAIKNSLKNYIGHLDEIMNSLLDTTFDDLDAQQSVFSNNVSLHNNYDFPLVNSINGIDNGDNKAISLHPMTSQNSTELFNVNPVTGLPMIGAYDAGGNPYGFNFNPSSDIHNHGNIIHNSTHVNGFNNY